ncbi:MAG: hypothetical protein JWR85_1682 [Marmoricola sp.]|nr:hypothetical protein [Marmoricola sp.]
MRGQRHAASPVRHPAARTRPTPHRQGTWSRVGRPNGREGQSLPCDRGRRPVAWHVLHVPGAREFVRSSPVTWCPTPLSLGGLFLGEDQAAPGELCEAKGGGAVGAFVVLLGRDGTYEADGRVAVGKDADDVSASSDLAVQPLLEVAQSVSRNLSELAPLASMTGTLWTRPSSRSIRWRHVGLRTEPSWLGRPRGRRGRTTGRSGGPPAYGRRRPLRVLAMHATGHCSGSHSWGRPALGEGERLHGERAVRVGDGAGSGVSRSRRQRLG